MRTTKEELHLRQHENGIICLDCDAAVKRLLADLEDTLATLREIA